MAVSVSTDPGPYPTILVLEPDTATQDIYRQYLKSAFPGGAVDCFSDMMSVHRYRKKFYGSFGGRYFLRKSLQSFGYELCITDFPGETVLEHRVAALRKGRGYFQYIALVTSKPNAKKIASRLRIGHYHKEFPTLLTDIVGDYRKYKDEDSKWIPGFNCNGPHDFMGE